MSPKERIRFLLARLPAGLLLVAALTGFWFLSQGMTSGRGSMIGYAETLLHNVGSLQAGRLKAIKVELGQSVRAGDVVALLDTRPLELQRESLQAELEQAKAQLVAEQDLQSALLQRSQLQAVRTHSSEERARAELRELDQQVNRLSKLDALHLVHASEVESARQRQRSVAADLHARPLGSSRELELMGFRPRPEIDQAQRLQDRLAPYRVAVRVKEAARTQLEYTIQEMTLRAPVDGKVGAILLQPGDVVSAGAPILSIITMRPGCIVVFIPERQITGITIGTPMKIRRFGLFEKTLAGHVLDLAPLVDEVPLRARPLASVPLWARRAVIKLEGPGFLLPGEAFHVSAR